MDSAAEIAKFIMHAEQLGDQRFLIFDLAKVFHDASGDEIKRGMLIALEIYEATEVGNHVS